MNKKMILNWKKIAEKIYSEIKENLSKHNKKPWLWVILVWNNPSSISYINQKRKFAEFVWMNFLLKHFDENVSEDILISEIKDFNSSDDIDWFIVQLPLPKHINEQKIIDLIDPRKDVDGFTKENIWKLFLWEENWLISCTPKWIKKLLDEYEIDLKWKNVTIIWKSNIVWKPLSLLFINHAATVTVCDIHTKNLSEHTLKSDIVVSAAGVPNLIRKEMIASWTIIIDVGFNFLDGKIVWDCDFISLEKENFITPVPGWVGPMTVAMLVENAYLAFLNKNERNN